MGEARGRDGSFVPFVVKKTYPSGGVHGDRNAAVVICGLLDRCCRKEVEGASYGREGFQFLGSSSAMRLARLVRREIRKRLEAKPLF